MRLAQDIRLLTYGFPRGRVSRAKNGFLGIHGLNVESYMHVSQETIEAGFGVAGRCRWQFDEHEQCQADDKEALRDYLGLEEDWRAVS